MRNLPVIDHLLLDPLLRKGPLEKCLPDAVKRLSPRPQELVVFEAIGHARIADQSGQLLLVERLVDLLLDLRQAVLGNRPTGIDIDDQRLDVLFDHLPTDLRLQLADLLRREPPRDLVQPGQRRGREQVAFQHDLGTDPGDHPGVVQRLHARGLPRAGRTSRQRLLEAGLDDTRLPRHLRVGLFCRDRNRLQWPTGIGEDARQHMVFLALLRLSRAAGPALGPRQGLGHVGHLSRPDQTAGGGGRGGRRRSAASGRGVKWP